MRQGVESSHAYDGSGLEVVARVLEAAPQEVGLLVWSEVVGGAQEHDRWASVTTECERGAAVCVGRHDHLAAVTERPGEDDIVVRGRVRSR